MTLQGTEATLVYTKTIRITNLGFLVRLLLLAGLIGWVTGLYAQPDTLWTRQYGEPHEDLDQAGLVLTSDQGYLIHCTQYLPESGNNFRLMKLDSLGDVEWDHVYGGPIVENHSVVKQTSDGGYILAGYTSSYGAWIGVDWSVLLMKIDSQGDSVWSRVYSYVNPAFPDSPYSLKPVDVVEAPDAGYTFVAAMGGNVLTLEMWIVKTSEDGDSLWTYVHENDSIWFLPNFLDVTIDGNYVVGGRSAPGRPPFCEDPITRDPWMMKLSSEGDSIWSYTYEGDGHSTVLAEGAIGELNLCYHECYPVTNDGRGIIVTQTDQFGHELWNRHFVLQPEVRSTQIWSISSTHDNGILLSLQPHDRINHNDWSWILKLSSSGDSLWSIVWDWEITFPFLFDMQQTQDGGYVALSSRDVWGEPVILSNLVLFRFGQEPQSTVQSGVPIPDNISLTVYPNPFNPTTAISFDLTHPGMAKLRVFDVTGRQVSALIEDNMTTGAHQVMFDGTGLASGIYFARLEAGEAVQTEKMVLLK